jgi:hypothetical protein
MPRRVESDEEDSNPRKRKTNTIKKPRATKGPATAPAKKAKSVQKEADSVLSAWAKRRTVESLDGIEDVDNVTPRKERRKLDFEVDHGMSFAGSG